MIQKLHDTFQPSHYALELDINSASLTFTGTVTIIGSLTKATDTLPLHAKDLVIKKASIDDFAVDFEQLPDDVLQLKLPDGSAEEVCVVIEFEGVITESMHGMYPSYFEHEGRRKKLIATQFESHHAREVFPCVDEPAAKATFDVTLITNKDEPVLSNMPAKESTVREDTLITTFETTPIMSTYLLAFVTGEMVMKESKTKDGVIVRSWASAAQDPSWLDYSVKETVDIIEFFNEYFGVAYPLTKCDQVALPDFDSGAMENWGLITYRETVLLADPVNKSISNMQLATEVIAHELSHQWFGNLVTMQWWDDLWLNESFASMIATLATDKLHPEWKAWEEYIALDGVSATNRDVYSDVQAVRVDVLNPAEIGTLFDPSIVYAKGGKLLKMLHDLLGEEAWRAGLKDYFTKHAYKNTTREDLWQALAVHTELDIADIMNTWIEKAGQPLITVNQQGSELTLTQSRLLLDEHEDSTIWKVPLLGEHMPDMLTEQSETFTLPQSHWSVANITGVGHFVTNYTNSAHKKWLTEYVASPAANTPWKITRLNELTMLARHGSASLTEALDTIQGCKNEERAMVWSLTAGVIGSAMMLVGDDEAARKKLKQLSGDLSKEALEQTGWDYPDNEDSNITHKRSIVLGMTLASEDEAAISEALTRFRAAKNPENLPSESRSRLMAIAVKFGTEDEFQSLVNAYTQTQNADYRADICSALTTTRKKMQIDQLLGMMRSTSVIRPQDLTRWYVYLLKNRHARDATWQWMKESWDWLNEVFGGSKSSDDFARYSASILSSKEMLEEYCAFFEPKQSDPALRRAIIIGIEELKARVAWRERDSQNVTQWVTEYSQ